MRLRLPAIMGPPRPQQPPHSRSGIGKNLQLTESTLKRTNALLIGCLLVASTVAAQDPKKTAAVLTGDAKGSAANNPVCKLFTAAEASKYVGKAVGEGQNSAMGSACQWAAKDYEGDMMVQIVAASYHERPKLAQ